MKKILLLALAALSLVLLLASSVSAENDDKITLVLDPGHGGHDPGTTVGTRHESEYNYDVALLLKEKLEATGDFEVYLSRARDEYKKYLIRAQVAYEHDADLLVSLHFNSNTALDPSLSGVEVLASVLDEWYPAALASSICENISSKCGIKNGGIKRVRDTGDSRGVYYWNEALDWDVPDGSGGRVSDYYSMIAWGTKLGFPSIIVEHAYLSSPSDRAFCDSEGGLERLAAAEAEAMIKYFTGHTHTYGAETCDRSANCCVGGVYSEKCTACGHKRNVRHTAPDPSVHAWVVSSKSATCTEDGYVHRECQISRNLSEKGFDYISVHTQSETYAATGHNLVTEVDTQASHGTNGLFRQRCTTCGSAFDEIRYGDPHVYIKTDSTPATCVAGGYDRYECSVCAHTYTDEYKATGHAFEADGEVLDCGSDGTKDYTCSVCGETASEDVDVPPHSFVLAEEVLPTCENDGKRVARCSVCSFEEVTSVDALGHDYGSDGEERTSPTYFREGEQVYKCKRDSSHEMIETIPKKPGGIYVMISVSAGVVAVAAGIACLLVRAGKRSLGEVSLEASEILAAGGASPDETTLDAPIDNLSTPDGETVDNLPTV